MKASIGATPLLQNFYPVQFSSGTHSRLTLCDPMSRSMPGLPVQDFTNSRTSLRLTSIKSVMPSIHLILCHPLLLLPSIPPSIRVFSNESTLRMRWPKYWSFSLSIIPSKEIPGLISKELQNPQRHLQEGVICSIHSSPT